MHGSIFDESSPGSFLRGLAGPLAILFSAFCFYYSTFLIKSGLDFHNISGYPFVFSRFFLGYVILELYATGRRQKANSVFWLRQRAIWNTIAVFFFFVTVEISGVTVANVLNMTYPAFVALLGPVFISERQGVWGYTGILLAAVGSYMIVRPAGGIEWQYADLIGLLSGLTAGIAILSLRMIRKTDSTLTILLYTFRIGTILSFPFAVYKFYQMPEIFYKSEIHFYLWFSALVGFTGQIFLTYGFRFVSAVQGSILSSSRVLIALAAGILLLEREVNLYSGLGALLVFFANVAVSLDKVK